MRIGACAASSEKGSRRLDDCRGSSSEECRKVGLYLRADKLKFQSKYHDLHTLVAPPFFRICAETTRVGDEARRTVGNFASITSDPLCMESADLSQDRLL